MLAWKIAPALACGNTVVLKPAETTPLTALLFADVCRQAELPPGVVNIVTGDGETGAHSCASDGIDKVAFTGLDRGREAIQRELAGRDNPLTLELGGKAANIVFDDCAARPGRRGDRQRHLLQSGPRLLRGLAAARAGVDPRPARAQAEAADGDAASRRPARQEHRRRRDQLEGAARPHHASSCSRRRRREPSCTSRRAGCRRRASGSRRRCSRASRRATASRRRRSSAPCSACSRSGRRTRRSRRRTTRCTDSRPASGRTRARDSLDGRPTARGRRVGQHLQQLRSGVAVRRIQGVRLRPRGRPPWARGVSEVRMTGGRLAVRKTYKLFIGGAFPRSESGRNARARGLQRRAGVTEGRARGRRRRPQGVRRLERRDGVQPRTGPVPARRDDGDSGRRVRSRVQRPS